MLFVLALYLCAAPFVHADDRTVEDRTKDKSVAHRVEPIEQAIEGMRHLGPMFIRTVLALERTGYDSNLFNSEEDPTDAFTATIAPQIEALLPVGSRQLFSASGQLGLVLYTESNPGNYLNGYGELNYDIYLKRIHLSLGDRYLQDRRRLNTEFDQRVLMSSNRADGGIELQLLTRLATIFTYNLEMIRFDSVEFDEDDSETSLSDRLDRDEHLFDWRTNFNASLRVTGYFEMYHHDYQFKTPGNFRESSDWGGTAGLEFDEEATISGMAEIEYSNFEADEVEEQNWSGLLWDASLTWKMIQRFHLSVGSGRSRNFSAYSTNLYFLHRNDQATFHIRLLDETWLGLGYAWMLNTYAVEDINTGTAEEPVFVAREDDITSPILTFSHQAGKVGGTQYTWSIESRYLSRDSNAVDDYERFFIFLSIKIER